MAREGLAQGNRANGSERKREHQCTKFAPHPRYLIDLIGLSVQSIMGATANPLFLFTNFGPIGPHVGLDGFICNFIVLEISVCNPVVKKSSGYAGVCTDAHAHV